MQLALTVFSSLLAILIMTTQLHGVCGQAYHFSKGWAAGKRSPVQVETGRQVGGLTGGGHGGQRTRTEQHLLQQIAVTNSQCHVRPDLNLIIEKLIHLEALRLEACHHNTQHDPTNFVDWIRARLHSSSGEQDKKK